MSTVKSSHTEKPEGARLIPTRERILREASTLFARKGYRGTSTREIASAVNIRQPSLFHHYASKAEILQDLLSLSLTQPTLFSEALAAGDGPAVDRLFEYLLFDTLFVLVSSYNLSGLDSDDVMEDPGFGKWFLQRERLRRARHMMVEQGIAAGEFLDVGADFATNVLTGVVRTVVVSYSGKEVADPAGLSRRIAVFAMRGLLVRPDQLDTLADRLLPSSSTDDQLVAALAERSLDASPQHTAE